MKHLEAIQAIIGDKALSPQLKFERVFQYEQGVLQPAWENAATMPRESMLCYLIDVLSVLRKNPLVPKQEWEDLAPVFLEGIAEFITSNAESITDPGLPKVLAAWRAMETNKQYTLMGGMYFAGEEKFCNRNAPDKRRVIESGPPVEHLMAIQAIVEDKSLSAGEKFEEIFQFNQNVLNPACFSSKASGRASFLSMLIDSFSIFRKRPIVPRHEWEDLLPVFLEAIAEVINWSTGDLLNVETARSRLKQTRDRVLGGRYMENIQTLLQDESLSPQERFEDIFQYWENVLDPAFYRDETLPREDALGDLIHLLSFLRRRPIVPKEEWEDLAPLYLEAIAEFIASDSGDPFNDPGLPKVCAARHEMEKRRDELVRGGKYFSDAEVYDWGTIEGMH